MPQMRVPTVSICLTTFRRPHILAKTIESILDQSFGDFELIITDDASPDNTGEIGREFERRDKRVRFIKQSVNVGMPRNLITGLELATAPFVANLHDGDIYRPDLIAKWKAALDEQDDAAFVFNSYVRLDESGRPTHVMSAGLPRRFEKCELVRYMLEPQRCFSSPVWGTVMGRTSLYRRVGGFDPHFGAVSDVALWLRLNAKFPVAFIDEPLIELHKSEIDRPGGFANWCCEQAIVEMYREAALATYAGSPNLERRLREMERIQERRWLAGLASCLRHERFDRAAEGVVAFRKQSSVLLRTAATCAKPIVYGCAASDTARRVLRTTSNLYGYLRKGRS